jgi:putative membrane protein
MRYLVWLFRVFLFVLLLGFAVKNDQPVALHYYFGYEWQTSLVVALLVFFAAGVVVGLLAMLLSLLKQRREVSVLKRELRLKSQLADAAEAQVPPVRPAQSMPATD